jgi:hypothetical protein
MNNNTFKINDNTSSFQNNSPSFFQWVQSISIYTWLLVFIVLLLLGFNIFIYLEKIVQYLKDGFKYISNIIQQPGNVSNEKEEDTNSQSNDQKIGDEHLHKAEDPDSQGNDQTISDDLEETKQRNVMNNNPLNLALNDNATRQDLNKEQSNDADYQADDSRSFLNSRKEGWCFIGENNGARVCGEVGLNDECMSGEIFPSSEKCVNPNIRV